MASPSVRSAAKVPAPSESTLAGYTVRPPNAFKYSSSYFALSQPEKLPMSLGIDASHGTASSAYSPCHQPPLILWTYSSLTIVMVRMVASGE